MITPRLFGFNGSRCARLLTPDRRSRPRGSRASVRFVYLNGTSPRRSRPRGSRASVRFVYLNGTSPHRPPPRARRAASSFANLFSVFSKSLFRFYKISLPFSTALLSARAVDFFVVLSVKFHSVAPQECGDVKFYEVFDWFFLLYNAVLFCR